MRKYKIAYAVLYFTVLVVVITPIHGMIGGIAPRIFGVPFSFVFLIIMAFLPSLALVAYDRKRFRGKRLTGDD